MKLVILIVIALFSLFALSKESRTMIGVIDTGIAEDTFISPFLCKGHHKDFTTEGLADTQGHGTNIAYLIAKSLDVTKQCLVVLKYYADGSNLGRMINALEYANTVALSYLNISSGGQEPDTREEKALRAIVARHVHVVVAAGNNGIYLKEGDCYYPACYKLGAYLHVIGALTQEKAAQSWSNYGPIVTSWEIGTKVLGKDRVSGTSAATAIYTGKIAGGIYK